MSIIQTGSSAIVVDPPYEIIEKLVAENDLKLLSPRERLTYYTWRCRSIGVDPAAQPFEYIVLDGKLCLYPKAGLADQLRQLHGLSVRLGESSLEHGVYTRAATASDRNGRSADNIGAVPVIYPEKRKRWDNGRSFWEDHPQAGKQYTGVDLANAMKKAATQAQRRATFSLMGLGGMDVDDVGDAVIVDTATVHDEKAIIVGLQPKPEPTQPAPAFDGPIAWNEPNKWPPDQPIIITAKVVSVRKSSKGDKTWLSLTVEDGDEIVLSTFHLSVEPMLNAAIGKVCDIMYARKERANQLLSIKELLPL